MVRPPMLRALFAAILLLAAGCANKSGREGQVKVVVGKRLAAMGVTLEDWRYSKSDATFGVKLKTTSPVPPETYLFLSGIGPRNVGSQSPSGDKINAGKWMDFGDPKSSDNPVLEFPEEGTITIEAR